MAEDQDWRIERRRFHQRPHSRRLGRISLQRRGRHPGQPDPAGDEGRLSPFPRTWRRRADGHRRDGSDADARPMRRASAPLVEQCAGDRSDPDDASRGAHAGHRPDGEDRARRRFHHGSRRGRRQAPPRRGRPQRHQQRHDPRPALSRRGAGDHDGRRPRRRRAVAYPARGAQSRHRGVGAGGGPPHRAHADQIRRRHDQAQSVGRRDHRDESGRDADGRGRGGDGGERGADPQQDAVGACALVRLDQAMRAPWHPEHLSRLFRRRGGARHARGGQGQAFRRALASPG